MAQLSGLTAPIWAAADQLRSMKATTGAALSAKFANEGSYQMAFGSLSTFFSGLEGLIGPPKMIEGSLMQAMRFEHCRQNDSAVPFNTSNGMEGVTSEKEWEFVTNPQEKFQYSERGGQFRDEHPTWCRRPLPLHDFEERMRGLNKKLDANGHTQMVVEELVGGRLYTGA